MTAIITLARASAICKERLGFPMRAWKFCAEKYPHLCAFTMPKGGGCPKLAGIYESRWRNFLGARYTARNTRDLLGDWVTP